MQNNNKIIVEMSENNPKLNSDFSISMNIESSD